MSPGLPAPPPRGPRAQGEVLAAVSLGGALGAAARYGVQLAAPAAPGGVPWSTLAVNVSGCLLIGVLMAALQGRSRAHRLARPFLGVGVLGGYTTFSTHAVDVVELAVAGRTALALGYLAGTAVAALVAVQLGLTATRAARGRAAR